ncbi:MAG: FAD-dependent oxidoreductase [Candidatus Atabeyarchaeum deiterrae]
MSISKNIVIVGAGIGGLGAGALLTKQGYKVKLLEKENRIGGRAFSYQHEGCTLDSGIDVAAFGSAGDLGKLLKATGADKYVPMGKDDEPQIMITDKDYTFPRNPIELNKWQAIPVDARMDMADIALQAVSKPIDELKKLDETSLHDFINERLPDEKYQTVMEALARCNLHVYSSKICSTWALIALYRSNLETSKFQAYPKQGVSSISSGLEKVIKENKGEIKLKSEVKAVIVEKGKAKGVQLADGTKVDSEIVVLNLPPKNIVKVLGTSAPKDLVEKAKNLKPVLDVLVSLCTDKPVRSGSQTLYFVPGTELYEMLEPTNINPGLAPAGKHIVKIAHTVESESEFKKTEEAILGDFHKKFPDIKVHWSKVTTNTKDNPAYSAGEFVGNQKYRLDVKCKEIEGLYFVGDGTGDPAPGMNVAAASASKLAKLLSAKT